MFRVLLFLFLILSLTNCQNSIERLKNIGQLPPLQEVSHHHAKAEEKETEPRYRRQNNSLWNPGARLFLKDNRASKVGDIIKVNIKVSDNAKLENESKRARKTTESLPCLLYTSPSPRDRG